MNSQNQGRANRAANQRSDREKTTRPAAAVNIPERDFRVEHAKKINHALASQNAKKQAMAEARRKYHAAWQEYYQKYYEHYYLAQLEAQKRQSTKPDAERPLSERQQAVNQLKKDLLKKLATGADKIKKSRHFKPLLAGLVAVLIMAFLQYNQLFSATWRNIISPGSEPTSLIIADGNNQPVSQAPTVLIPKLSVKAPIIFDLNNLTETSAQSALEKGVINFPVAGANSRPGQNGNTVILGHSSSDIFNNGQYKFIFVQLNRLDKGDLFYIDYAGLRYTYEISDKKIISPSDLGQLNLGSDSPYATLITCDPPGTTLKRLLVIGQQINPNPKKANAAGTENPAETKNIPGNPPTIFEKLFN